jgi:pilus assembly protein CpaC
LLLALCAQALLSVAAVAASAGPPHVDIEVSEGRLLTLGGPASSVFLADPNIADIQVPQPNRIFIFGKKAGRTTLHALDASGQQIAAYEVIVHHPAAVGAQQAASALPGAGDVKMNTNDSGVVMQGTVPDAASAAALTASAKASLPKEDIVDGTQLKIGSSQQVMLRVWVGEVSRTVTKDLAFNWDVGLSAGAGVFDFFSGRQTFTTATATTPAQFILPSGDFGSSALSLATKHVVGGTVIDALASEGLVTTLAEPTLIALSGEAASFLAGGQFPVPIVQPGATSNAISIEFETFGVSLSFTPTVLASNRISLKVRPEVSQLSTEAEVNFNGYTIPSLTIRRASTVVELGSGQSFAIAGLIQNTTTTTIQKYPGLGDLPVLGTLFRSNNFQRGESELVIIITPYLVKPVDDPNRLKLPIDGISMPNDLERIFRGRIAQPSASGYPAGAPSNVSILTGPRLAGDAGFDLE